MVLCVGMEISEFIYCKKSEVPVKILFHTVDSCSVNILYIMNHIWEMLVFKAGSRPVITTRHKGFRFFLHKKNYIKKNSITNTESCWVFVGNSSDNTPKGLTSGSVKWFMWLLVALSHTTTVIGKNIVIRATRPHDPAENAFTTDWDWNWVKNLTAAEMRFLAVQNGNDVHFAEYSYSFICLKTVYI